MISQSPPVTTRSARSRRTGLSPLKASPASSAPSAAEAYRLSRVQAEGWNAAHRIGASTLDTFDGTQIESLNPYALDPERTRWCAGFRRFFCGGNRPNGPTSLPRR